MAKSEYIVISNPQVVGTEGGNILVHGRIFNTRIAGKRLLKKFIKGIDTAYVTFSTDSYVSQCNATITNTPVSEIESIRTQLTAERDVMSSAELCLAFEDGVLTSAYVTTHYAD